MSKKQAKDKFEAISSLYFLLMFVFILLTSYISNTNMFLVLVGFSPTLTVIIISLLVHEQAKHHKHLLWLVPVVVLAGFFALKNSPLFITMDVEVLTGINFLLSMLYVIFAFAIFGTKEEEVVVESIEELMHVPTKKDPKEELQEYIHSIEDKSKALNFAIGRVYNHYHGGNKKLREKIQIDSELYNEFSLMGIGEGEIDKEKLKNLIEQIEKKLLLYQNTEKEVFGTNANLLRNIIRDPDGTDKIIDVLDHNDKDPVRSYYEGALEFCQKVKEEIDNLEVSLVKNEYIPKNEEDAEKSKSKLIKDSKE